MYQCPPAIASFTPDGLPVLYYPRHGTKRVILYEFSRCMGTQTGDLDQRHTEKAQAYHELPLYLSRLLPDYSVELITFVMTISGSIPAPAWDSNFTALKVRELEPPPKQLLRDSIVHAIQSLYEFLGVRRSRIPAGLAAITDSNG
eukprot:1360840-Rhodomonas_salina.1